jgi:hypothetical protein
LALETVHFERCDNGEPEAEYEKAVIFHRGGQFTHIAALSSVDTAKSKLGEYEDLEHPLRDMQGGLYGKIFVYLKRQLKFAGEPLPDEYKL